MMNRRGFISSIKSIFDRRREGDPFFFGVQIVINVFGEDELRKRLHRVISSAPATESPRQKHDFYKQVAALLRENIHYFEYGYWDYITDPVDAEAEFHDWVAGVEASTATVGEELGEEVDEAHRLSREKDYVVVTIAFLLEFTNSQTELIGMLESIPEEEAFAPLTFRTLVEAVNYVDHEYSLGDGIFILPGTEDDGFSWTDMRAEGWDYLQPIMGSIN